MVAVARPKMKKPRVYHEEHLLGGVTGVELSIREVDH